MRRDLLNLDEAALIDLTNKGSVRRALKSAATETFTFTVNPDESVLVEASDDVVSTLLFNRPLMDWPCSCTSPTKCWHLPRAVFAYQQQHKEAMSPADSAAHSAPTSAQQDSTQPPFHPKYLTNEDLKDAIPAGQLRKASRLVNQGVVCHLGTTNTFTSVTLFYPEIASVRFLARHDLNHARCTCPLGSHCAHVAAAVRTCWNKAIPGTSLHASVRTKPSEPSDILDTIDTMLHDVLHIGLESAAVKRPHIERVTHQAQEHDLPAFSELSQELLDEFDRYATRVDSFDARLVVAQVSEMAARSAALRAEGTTVLPARIIGGVSGPRTRKVSASLIGLGTTVEEVDDTCWVRIYMVDVRTSRIIFMNKLVNNHDQRDVSELAQAKVIDNTMAEWGVGQIQVSNGMVSDAGKLVTRGARASVYAQPGLELVPVPVRAETIAQLQSTHLQAPRVLDVRLPSTGIGLCLATEVVDISVDGATQTVHATLRDPDGALFLLKFTPVRSHNGGARALVELLQRWQHDGSNPLDTDGDNDDDGAPAKRQPIHISGHWRWAGPRPEVTPYLLVRGDEAFQPFIAPSQGRVESTDSDSIVTSVDAVLHELDTVLAATITAGVDRIANDLARWEQFSDAALGAGANHLATMAWNFRRQPDASTLMPLLLFRAFAH